MVSGSFGSIRLCVPHLSCTLLRPFGGPVASVCSPTQIHGRPDWCVFTLELWDSSGTYTEDIHFGDPNPSLLPWQPLSSLSFWGAERVFLQVSRVFSVLSLSRAGRAARSEARSGVFIGSAGLAGHSKGGPSEWLRMKNGTGLIRDTFILAL